ncbi:hypothetical protein OH76DRAFT_1551675 [Lentinus brumalis]|uniref:Uncharacterized protein n=1 Tax=Lentinus brumalis TaxID=2498619 RepID=A0A371DUN3_9APHY|nr:hypothetical protein OH76DRAFT_1551675 [Polyporus brumalis]
MTKLIPQGSPLWTRAKRKRYEEEAAQAAAAAAASQSQASSDPADPLPLAASKVRAARRKTGTSLEIEQGGEHRTVLVDRGRPGQVFQISPPAAPPPERVAKKELAKGLKLPTSARQVDSEAPSPHVRWTADTRNNLRPPKASVSSNIPASGSFQVLRDSVEDPPPPPQPTSARRRGREVYVEITSRPIKTARPIPGPRRSSRPRSRSRSRSHSRSRSRSCSRPPTAAPDTESIAAPAQRSSFSEATRSHNHGAPITAVNPPRRPSGDSKSARASGATTTRSDLKEGASFVRPCSCSMRAHSPARSTRVNAQVAPVFDPQQYNANISRRSPAYYLAILILLSALGIALTRVDATSLSARLSNVALNLGLW